MLDGGYPSTAPMIMASIAKLGFDITDVKGRRAPCSGETNVGLQWAGTARTDARICERSADRCDDRSLR